MVFFCMRRRWTSSLFTTIWIVIIIVLCSGFHTSLAQYDDGSGQPFSRLQNSRRMDIASKLDANNTCPENYFQCADNLSCIPNRWKCDSKNDCDDGSDEPEGCASNLKCNEKQFQCVSTKKCIPESWVCDQEFDCGLNDTSDEMQLQCHKHPNCLPNQSACGDNKCLDIEHFCNGQVDCSDDELNCTDKETQCATLKCSFDCRLTPNGPKCFCALGQQPNGTQCEDFDECNVDSNCDQICKNTPGSYECSCHAGYIKEKNRCHGINVPKDQPASLIFLTQMDVRRVTLEGEEWHTDTVYNISNQVSMDIWHRNKTVCIFYHNPNDLHNNFRCHDVDNFSNQWEMPIPDLLQVFPTINQIRLDWISGNWYFLNTEFGVVFVCSGAMKHCTIIYKAQNLVHPPRSIAIDPTKGYMFYVKVTKSIDRSLLDGTNMTTLVSNKVVYPYSLTLDLANQHVYWIDTYMDYIERVNYDGTGRWSLRKSTNNYYFLKSMFSVEIFENNLFFASGMNFSICSIDKYSTDAKLLVSNLQRPNEIHVYHRQKQPEVAHPCRDRNGGCEHLCIPAWKKGVAIAQCMCSPGFRLKLKTQCVLTNHPTFLIYVERKPVVVKGIAMSTKVQPGGGMQEAIVPIYGVKTPISIDYNVKDQLIYFTQSNIETGETTIESQGIDGTGRTIITKINRNVENIAYDWMGNNMFYSSNTDMAVLSLTNTSLRRSLFRINGIIGSITLDPKQGKLYWSQWSSLGKSGSIESAWMDGTHKIVLVNESRIDWPASLTIDYLENKLYWCDLRNSVIERIDLDGKGREVLLHPNPTSDFFPLSIAYHNQYIFWTNNAVENISRMHLNSLSNDTTPHIETLAAENSASFDLKVFDNMTQTGWNDCSNMREFPGICLFTPVGAVYKCGDGFTLSASGYHCLPQSPSTRCTDVQFLCKAESRCINKSQTCDGEFDCLDGSDELPFPAGPCSQCDPEFSFACDKNKCINRNLLCNGVNDCEDGTDERQLMCNLSCAPNQFKCNRSLRCIPLSWVCDGVPDCLGQEDESMCEKCPEFECANKVCIKSEEQCDGINTCGDNSDEQDCEKSCADDEMYCVPLGCVSKENVCDGVLDCFNGEDEKNCDEKKVHSDNKKITVSVNCGVNDFRCANGIECVYKSLWCDGYANCFDGSDEKNCTSINWRPMENVTIDCPHPDRICRPTGECLSVNKLCDGRIDCIDGSDEGFRCDEKLCDHHNECSHTCHNAPEGYVCSCPFNMFLKPNGKQCSTQHACEHWGTCSQLCQQVGKRYKCECHEGYTLQYDNFSCKSNNPDIPYVIFSNRMEIKGVDLKTLAVKHFYTSLKNIIALDFLYTNDSVQIFWTDVREDKIYRGTLKGENLVEIEPVVESGLSTAEGLAVDWIGLNLYWVDSNLDQIEVSKINGSFRKTLVEEDVDSPRAISLDPRDGFLFWTDWDTNSPRIERCSMAGEFRETIVELGRGAWPNGLTLDYTEKRVYWNDAKSDSIHTTNYNGKDQRLVFRDEETLSHPFSISVFENHVYWTDWRTNSVIRANKWNGSDTAIIQRTSTQPCGIQLLHSSRQPQDGTNPCGDNNGGCSHLCLLSFSKTYTCHCPYVMRLDKDNRTCVPIEQILLFITDKNIRGVALLQPNQHIIPAISHSMQVMEPNVVDFIVEQGRLYWSDVDSNEIKTAGLSNGLVETIFDTDIHHPVAFAVDWIANNLYFATLQKETFTILASNLKGEYVTIVHENLLDVISLALDPENGQMFWCHKNELSNTYVLDVSKLDGSDRTTLTSAKAMSLSLDSSPRRLYFVDGTSFTMNFYDFTTKTTKQFSPTHLASTLTVYLDSIYYWHSTDQAIKKCDKNNCQTEEEIRAKISNVHSLRMYYPTAQQGSNTCATNKGGCQHLCFATHPINRVCRCMIGYHEDPNDKTNCIGEQEFLLYSLGYLLKGVKIPELGSTSIKMDAVLAPIPKIVLASYIDYHAKDGYLFWADSDRGLITRINRDGTNRTVIVSPFENSTSSDGINFDWLGGIAVDWIAENIYWSDKQRNVIEVARLDGTYRYVVISNIDKPSAIALDPITGVLFYATQTYIGRIGLDGSQLFILANHTAGITSLVLDIPNQVVMWSESNSDTIMRVDYDGNRKQVMLNHSLVHPVAIAILGNTFFWADNSHDNGSIKMAPVTNLSDYTTLLRAQTNQLKDLKIYSNRIQSGVNPCSIANGGCQELCLFNGTNPICACSHGKVASNGKTCDEYDVFLVYSRVQSIESIHMTDTTNVNGPIASIKSPMLKNAIGMTYDFIRKRIFFSDIQWNSINCVDYNGSNVTVIVQQQMAVEGIAYDPISNHLFWTSNNDASIRSLDMLNISSNATLNKDIVKQIIKLNTHDKPRGIAIEPCLTLLYWTNWNLASASIQRAYISGFGVQSIITTDIRMPNAITLDYEENKLYWADARLDKIERADYDGLHRVVVTRTVPKHPFGIAVFGDLLFWTDWVLHAVLRTNKYTGSDVVYLRKNVGRPMGIVAVQNNTRVCSASPCQLVNGGCEDVCTTVKATGAIKCECTQGMLAADGKRCLQFPGVICEVDYFQCSSGECIPLFLTCDQERHCLDGSDEKISYCSTRECPESHFQCLNHRCVPLSAKCDAIQDCGDGSDEESCGCGNDHFECGSGECVSKKFQCDFQPDCIDASDEFNCPTSTCHDDIKGLFVPCNHTSACYMPAWKCDGENDCWDGSDEVNCPNVTTMTCGVNQFACGNGNCIAMSWRCDGEDDCHDMPSGDLSTDESNCTNKCPDNRFHCDTTCIEQAWVCDNHTDCLDGTDEGPHCNLTMCGDMFRCNSTGRCIERAWLCDGDLDCTNGEDEMDCKNTQGRCNSFGSVSFFCKSNECISASYVCDGDNDCVDGSDEQNCEPPPSCQDDEYLCITGICIPASSVCDLKNDCGDNSDEVEHLCKNSTVICAEPMFFRCNNGVCVKEEQLCDGENNCGDYSDERACHINECESIENLCAHSCQDRKVGYECQCNPGFKVSHKSRNLCEDIDECEDRPCSQNCRNTIGSFKCSCNEGYIQKGNLSCKADSAEPSKLIFSNRYYIREVNLLGEVSVLESNSSNAVALDFEWETGCYYWSDVRLPFSSIKKHCTKENKTMTLHPNTLKNPDGLAVDWVAKNLYWCDKGLDTIEVSKLDGKYRKVLINQNLEEPRAIALHPFKKYIFWTDWGARPHIGRAGMDGSQQKMLVGDNLGWPNALTISFETDELFWGDAREDYIAVSDLDGNNKKIIISRQTNPKINLHHVFAIAVWEDQVYWTDWETKSIEHCHKYRGDECGSLYKAIHRPMDLRIYHPFRQQPAVDNPCATANCSTLCLLSPDEPGYQCACPDHFILDVDKRSCIQNCTSSHFVCESTMKCIPFFWRCDTQDDCGDGSDEPPSCRPFSCKPGQYQCSNGHCVEHNLYCDGIDQCGDGSDEVSCEDFVCFKTQFKCSNSTKSSAFCIDEVKRCDGTANCPNGDDEKDCHMKPCPPDKFRCNLNSICIPMVWSCDGDIDCKDGSDEVGCDARTCGGKEFRCNSGRCIPQSWICDGEEDCPGKEDEPATCKISSSNYSCDPTYFRCANSKCIPGRWQCDVDNDCGDDSDEIGCTMRNCSESEFRCTNGRCIKASQKCDGEYDCSDQSDEQDCTIDCDGNFQCPGIAKCVDKLLLCDGENDCPDGSDEINCECPQTHFRCHDGLCIRKRWLCDGLNDCRDGSDELFEFCATHGCHPLAYPCNNKKCISADAVCDGNDDCGDGSDEQDYECDLRYKCRHSQFQCESDKRCIDMSMRCNNVSDCEDDSDEINCKTDICSFGKCSQTCEVVKQTHYKCHCASSYRHLHNSTFDKCAINASSYLIMTLDNGLGLLPGPSFNKVIQIFEGKTKIEVVAVYVGVKDLTFFTASAHDVAVQKIKIPKFSALLSPKFTPEKVSEFGQPKNIAVDWLNKKLYVIYAKHRSIVVSEMNGTKHTTLVKDLIEPQDIVVDPSKALMIWSTLDTIMSAYMDGSNARTVIRNGVEWPIGLALDFPAKRLYWCDYRKNTIETALYNGMDRHIIWKFNADTRPTKLNVLEESVFVLLNHNALFMINKFGHGEMSGIMAHTSVIAVYNDQLYPKDAKNECSSNPCDTSAICLLASPREKRACKCPDGLIKINVEKGHAICRLGGSLDDFNEDNPCNINCRGGTCVMSEKFTPKCQCKPEFTGEYCEIYRCSGYCKHGFCSTHLLSNTTTVNIKCLCAPGWTGDRCDIPVETCQHINCHNNANCTVKDDGKPICVCLHGYKGDKCENCYDLDCRNDGFCRIIDGKQPKCECRNGFSGQHCEISDCEGYCNGRGKCKIHLGGPMCECDGGYWGKQCEINKCTDYCKNGGVCNIHMKAISCECPPHFGGDQCEKDLCAVVNPPDWCSSNAASAPMPCEGKHCENGGMCLSVHGQEVCNCSQQYNGADCEAFVGPNNPCINYCLNNGICKLDKEMNPSCICVGEWVGRTCISPPRCSGECGHCKWASSINECMCEDGRVVPCIYDNDLPAFNNEMAVNESTSSLMKIIFFLFIALVLVVLLFGSLIYYFRRHRIRQPFSHARLNDNVEITNPMYTGEVDDTPAFVHNDDKDHLDEHAYGHFSNQIYESIYAGGVGASADGSNTVLSQNKNHGGTDEHKGLLEHLQEDTLT